MPGCPKVHMGDALGGSKGTGKPHHGICVVDRVVCRDFVAEEYDAVTAMLSEYGKERWHREPTGVQLAALKAANGNQQKLRACIESAKRDYRDALAAAEYPACSKIGFRLSELPAKERSRIIGSDWRQYEEWLKR